MRAPTGYCCVVTHGLFPRYSLRDRDLLTKAKKRYVADGAVAWAQLFGLELDFWAGDGDSLHGSIPEVRYEKEKDFIDGEAVLLRAVKDGFRRIVWFGALGGRRDMEYAHLDLMRTLCKQHQDLTLLIVHEEMTLTFLCEKRWEWAQAKGAAVSLWGSSEDRKTLVETRGLRYNLKKDRLTTSSHGLSNECLLSKASLRTRGGGLFVSVSAADVRPLFWPK